MKDSILQDIIIHRKIPIDIIEKIEIKINAVLVRLPKIDETVRSSGLILQTSTRDKEASIVCQIVKLGELARPLAKTEGEAKAMVGRWAVILPHSATGTRIYDNTGEEYRMIEDNYIVGLLPDITNNQQ